MTKPDKKRALSLILASKKQMDFTFSLVITNESGFNITRNIYECFRVLGEALLIAQGVKPSTHEIQIDTITKINVATERPIGAIIKLTSLRNQINYNGYTPNLAEVEDAISIAKSCFEPLYNAIKSKLSE